LYCRQAEYCSERISALCAIAQHFPIAALEPVSHARTRARQKRPARVRALKSFSAQHDWSKCRQVRLMPGGCHVPLPTGRIEGASVFGQ
jgi:hypothetical protein